MTTIIEKKIMKDILKETCSILRRNFFYEDERLVMFLNTFTDEIQAGLELFKGLAESRVIDELHNNKIARIYFTCYFISIHLRDFFIYKFHFTEQELYAFDSLLPTFTGEVTHEEQQRCSRAYYREFFE